MLRKTNRADLPLSERSAVLIFWEPNRCDFINYDDPAYLTENTQIQNGVTLEAVRWAFTTGYAANWHPLTWLSHMVDIQLLGLKPHGHHFTSLLFHIANTLLLFFVLNRMTKAPWKCAFVAALFALHPLHVESVAWVAERKDVLSTFFWMLTMAGYVRYVEDPRLKNYMAVILFFVLGLMAKPMLVTLPFVLLLLDYWPLCRFELNLPKKISRPREKRNAKKNSTMEGEPLSAGKKNRVSGNRRSLRAFTQSSVLSPQSCSISAQSFALRPLLVEKIPLFALAALSCIVTYIVQQKGGAVRSIEEFSLGDRIANAFVSYIIYVEKTIWPNNLAVYYPHPESWPLWQTTGAVLILAAVTLTVIRTANRFPYLASGWLWFAGTLVPVIGIVQIGTQAMADRYTYIPLIGLFIMAAWGIPDLLKNRPYRNEALFASSALILACLSIVTWRQVGYWRDSISLYDHALEVIGPDDVIFCNRGVARDALGGHLQAISDYDRAIGINPHRAEAYHDRGLAYGTLGNYGQEVSDCSKAIEIYPEYANAFGHRGAAWLELGNYGQAISDFGRAIEIDPKLAWAYGGRGRAYGKLGSQRQAISDFEKALEMNPEYSEVYNNRGVAYAILGNNKQAISDYDRAIEIDPAYANAYYNRGVAYGELGNQRQAISDYDRAVEINPEYADAYNNRGAAYERLGDRRRGIEELQKAARLGSVAAKNSLRSIGVSW